MSQYVGFYLDKSEYTIPILEVQEIIKVPHLTKMPQAPSYVEGVTNLRGNVIPVLNLKSLINLSGNGNASDKVIVIARDGNVFGILVDKITGVLNIDDQAVEPAGSLFGEATGQIKGVARLGERLVVIIDSGKIIKGNYGDLIAQDSPGQEEVREIEGGEKVEVTKRVNTAGGLVEFKEVKDAKEYWQKTGLSQEDPRFVILQEIMQFMQAISDQNFDLADNSVRRIIATGQSDLFQEVGKVTRKLHDALLSFRESLDPRLKEITVNEMPGLVDRLNFVIDRTKEAADSTMGIAEKYLLKIDELGDHIRQMNGPEASVAYLKEFRSNLEDDLISIITAQSFQDLTGQTIKKVIALVKEIEVELVRVVKTFGINLERDGEKPGADMVSQSEVDDLLKTLGF